MTGSGTTDLLLTRQPERGPAWGRRAPDWDGAARADEKSGALREGHAEIRAGQRKPARTEVLVPRLRSSRRGKDAGAEGGSRVPSSPDALLYLPRVSGPLAQRATCVSGAVSVCAALLAAATALKAVPPQVCRFQPFSPSGPSSSRPRLGLAQASAGASSGPPPTHAAPTLSGLPAQNAPPL